MHIKQIMPGPGGIGGAVGQMIFYPDPAGPTCDGMVWHAYVPGGGQNWATIIAAVGTNASRAGNVLRCTYFVSEGIGVDVWQTLRRVIIIFNTSALPNTATIISASLELYGESKIDNFNNNPDLNVYSAAPATDDNLVPADFTTLGIIPYSAPIAFVAWDLTAYNVFTLNAAGRAAISLTGNTRFGVRNANFDVAGIVPALSLAFSTQCHLDAWSVEAGPPFEPRLVVNYTI